MTQATRSAPRWNFLAWLIPVLVAAGLGAYRLGTPQLWRDELASWSASSRSWSELFSLGGNVDAVHLPYYLGLHAWISIFGDSVVSLRLPSLLAIAATAALVAATASLVGGPWSGLLAGVVFALVPAVSRIAQEARPYAFVLASAALATFLLLLALMTPRRSRWIGYGLAVALVGLTNIVALTLVAGHAAVVLTRRSRSSLVAFVVAVAGALVVISPLLVLGWRQQGRQIGWIPTPTWPALFGADYPFAVDTNLWAQVFRSTSITVALAVLVLAGLVGAAWRRVELWWAIAATAVISVVAVWVLSQRSVSYYFPRYLLFTIPLWCVLVGAVLTLATARLFTIVALIVGVVGLGALGYSDQAALRAVGSHDSELYPGKHLLGNEQGAYTGYAELADMLAGAQKPGDGIVYERGFWMLDTGLAYYARQPVPTDVFLAIDARERRDLFGQECTDYTACWSRTQPGRLWVIQAGERAENLEPDPVTRSDAMPDGKLAVLRQEYSIAATYHPPGLTMTLLNRT